MKLQSFWKFVLTCLEHIRIDTNTEICVSFQFKNRALLCRSNGSLHVSLEKNISWRNSLGKCFKIFSGLWFSVAGQEEPARLLST